MSPAATPIPLFERLQLESQANCNRSCWFCPRSYDATGKYLDGEGRPVLAQMPTATILDVLDQVVEMGFRGLVGFHHYSEPLLDPRNPMLAEEALARGLRPYLHTNGDVLRRDEELCAEVARLYSLIVVGLYDYRTPDELEAEKTYWRARLGAADLRFSAISATGARGLTNMSVPKALVPPDARMGAPDLVYPNAPCHRPLIRLIIQYDGSVCNCCEDTSGAFDLGNVHDNPVRELWYSQRHAEVIADLVEGRRERHALCARCPLSPSGPAPGGERLRIAPRRASGS